MLAFLSGVAVPALAFILMLIVGLDLTIDDFRRVSRYPRTVVLTVLGQVLLLPLLAIALVVALKPNDAASAGILFLALSPGGAISNYYTHLARRDVALSVTLTAFSTVLSLASIPAWAFIYFAWTTLIDSTPPAPTSLILLQLGIFVMLPISLGMWLGRALHRQLDPWKPNLRTASLVLVALLLAASIWTVRDEFAEGFTETARLALFFTVGAMLVGALIATFVSPKDRHVVVIESTVRNIPVAVLIGSGVAVTPAFAGFVATYFMIEVGLMIPYALWVRGKSVAVS